MRGSRKIRRSNSRHRFYLPLSTAAVLVLSILFGWKGTEEAKRSDVPEPTLQNFLDTYEKTFNPSDFDAGVGVVKQEELKQREAIEAALVATNAVPETIAGFRVQVLFTQDIDRANETREELSAQIPEEWVYVVYDAPYYKVRVGNYVDRPAASQALKKLVGLGFKDAWVVPDNIIKNPPPKPPDTFIEPEKR